MKHVLISIAALFLVWPLQAENARVVVPQPTKLLFVGSSLTVNQGGLYNHFDELCKAAAEPDLFDIEYTIIGGANNEHHWEAGNVQPLIRNGNFDAVIMQQMPHRFQDPKKGRADSAFIYGKKMIDLIDSVGSQPVWYMTWNKVAWNWAPEVPAAIESVEKVWPHVPIVPVGFVWEVILNETNPRDSSFLYEDGVHPTLEGMYLNACIFYSSFTLKSPVGNSYIPAGVSADDAAYLQQTAWDYMKPYVEGAASITAPATAGHEKIKLVQKGGNIVHVSCPGTISDGFITVKDVQGTQRYKSTLRKEQDLHLNTLKTGIYFIRVSNEQRISTVKLFIR